MLKFVLQTTEFILSHFCRNRRI